MQGLDVSPGKGKDPGLDMNPRETAGQGVIGIVWVGSELGDMPTVWHGLECPYSHQTQTMPITPCDRRRTAVMRGTCFLHVSPVLKGLGLNGGKHLT